MAANQLEHEAMRKKWHFFLPELSLVEIIMGTGNPVVASVGDVARVAHTSTIPPATFSATLAVAGTETLNSVKKF